MLCRARTQLLAAATAVLATALMATTAGATTINVPVPVGLFPAGATAAADKVDGLVRAVSTTSCRGADGRPGATSHAKLRSAMLCLVNHTRGLWGLGAVRANRRLALAAQRHAGDMARRGYFAHVSPQGSGPAARARAVGWRGAIGEILASGTGALTSPAATVVAWLQSPPHRAVLLGRARVAGVGMVDSSARRAYWVMNFG
jgi:uncharacterized protein YkwD